jgi:hypothetical protein
MPVKSVVQAKKLFAAIKILYKTIKVRLCNICSDKKYLLIINNSSKNKKINAKQFLSGQKLLSISLL